MAKGKIARARPRKPRRSRKRIQEASSSDEIETAVTWLALGWVVLTLLIVSIKLINPSFHRQKMHIFFIIAMVGIWLILFAGVFVFFMQGKYGKAGILGVFMLLFVILTLYLFILRPDGRIARPPSRVHIS